MKQIFIIITLGLAVIVLVSILIFQRITDNPVNDTWITLNIPDKGKVGYSIEALDNDIPLPKLKTIEGCAKFINRNGNSVLGYKVSIDINHLDTLKVPQKYLRASKPNEHGLITPALSEVTYESNLTFTLLDKDNFELQKVTSTSLYIESGKKNEFQDFIEATISLKTIEMTKSIKLNVSVLKCLSCDNEKQIAIK